MKTINTAITPEFAAQLLSNSRYKNRKLRQRKVKIFLDIVKSGRWKNTHQGIAVYIKDGAVYLFDGQHRVSAIALSGLTVFCNVTYFDTEEEANEAIPAIDILNEGRTAEDIADIFDLLTAPKSRKIRVGKNWLALENMPRSTRDEFLSKAVEVQSCFDDCIPSGCSRGRNKLPPAAEVSFVYAYDALGPQVPVLLKKILSGVDHNEMEALLAKLTFAKPEKVKAGCANTAFQNHCLKILRMIDTCVSGNKTPRLTSAMNRDEVLSKLQAKKMKRLACR